MSSSLNINDIHTPWQLIKWGLRSERIHLFRIFVLAGIIFLLSLILPFLIAILFDDVIPSGSMPHLFQIATGVLITILSSMILSIAQTVSIAGIAQRSTHVAQSALLDRLLHLSPTFFRRFSSGDLAYRALSIDSIRQTMSDAVLSSIFLGFFSVFYLVALFVIDVKLAFVVTVLMLAQIAILATLYFFHIRALQDEGNAIGEGNSWLYNVLSGISKIRVAGAEVRVFSKWLKTLDDQITAGRVVGKIAAIINTFNTSYQLIIFVAMVWVIAQTPRHYLSIGGFLAFGSLLLMLSSSISKMSEWISIFLQIIPSYRSLAPILEAVPEVTEYKRDTGVLTGAIDIQNVSFQYENSPRQILFDINLGAKPGQFVAIVGSSGSGKSTLLRLLLGFEEPSSGAILYDHQNLQTINILQVRRQLGVVLQNGKLFPGSILDNIVGANMLSMDDAWEAAKMSGLDDDIKAMPMGMQTLVSLSGGISGGQRQRILIARALVRKPKILFFDEATSALDNQTQKIVTDSIGQLHVTRVVIAHRLSTIRDADVIYVIEAGRMVESGQFDELMAKGGAFAKLTKRQLIKTSPLM